MNKYSNNNQDSPPNFGGSKNQNQRNQQPSPINRMIDQYYKNSNQMSTKNQSSKSYIKDYQDYQKDNSLNFQRENQARKSPYARDLVNKSMNNDKINKRPRSPTNNGQQRRDDSQKRKSPTQVSNQQSNPVQKLLSELINQQNSKRPPNSNYSRDTSPLRDLSIDRANYEQLRNQERLKQDLRKNPSNNSNKTYISVKNNNMPLQQNKQKLSEETIRLLESKRTSQASNSYLQNNANQYSMNNQSYASRQPTYNNIGKRETQTPMRMMDYSHSPVNQQYQQPYTQKNHKSNFNNLNIDQYDNYNSQQIMSSKQRSVTPKYTNPSMQKLLNYEPVSTRNQNSRSISPYARTKSNNNGNKNYQQQQQHQGNFRERSSSHQSNRNESNNRQQSPPTNYQQILQQQQQYQQQYRDPSKERIKTQPNNNQNNNSYNNVYLGNNNNGLKQSYSSKNLQNPYNSNILDLNQKQSNNKQQQSLKNIPKNKLNTSNQQVINQIQEKMKLKPQQKLKRQETKKISNNLTPKQSDLESTQKTQKLQQMMHQNPNGIQLNKQFNNYLNTQDNDDTISTTSTNLEYVQTNILDNVNINYLIEMEQCLFSLSSKKTPMQITKICKNYLTIIGEHPLNNIDKMVASTMQQQQIVKLVVLERICIVLMLNEALQSKDPDHEFNNNIFNSIQYVHTNFILFLDIIMGKYNFESKEIIQEQLEELMSERLRTKKIPIKKNKNDKYNQINNYNDIIMPIIKLMISTNDDEPFQTIDIIIESINKYSISKATHLLMGSCQKILKEIEKNMDLFQKQDNLLKQQQNNNSKQNTNNQQQQKQQHDLQQQQQKEQEKENEQKKQLELLKKQQEENEEQNKRLQQEQQQQQQQQHQEEDEDKLPEVFPPFLPPLPENQKHRYTLALDLDETLVHYQENDKEEGGQFLVRPYAEQFIQSMSKYYELVIFTAALQDYADFILDIIDSKKLIASRLYRQHCSMQPNGSYVKDISKMGRSLEKIMIVDNLAENFVLQSKNGILIQSWYGEPDDRALYELMPLLENIVQSQKIHDVRIALEIYRKKTMRNIERGIENPHLNIDLDNQDEGDEEYYQ